MKKRLKVESEDGTQQDLEIRVFLKDDVWTCTLHKVSASGEVEEGSSGLAPVFYGTSEKQAERQMRCCVSTATM